MDGVTDSAYRRMVRHCTQQTSANQTGTNDVSPPRSERSAGAIDERLDGLSGERPSKPPAPLICLAPMDGVTDSAYRRMVRHCPQQTGANDGSPPRSEQPARVIDERPGERPGERPSKRPAPLICLAPMDGVTDSAYRRMVRHCTQQTSANQTGTNDVSPPRSERSACAIDERPGERPGERPAPLICLAPMDGVTDSAYRRMVRHCTQQTSANDGSPPRSEQPARVIDERPGERPGERPAPLICLAPMDGVTDSAYRRMVRHCTQQTSANQAGTNDVWLFSEFTSAEGFLRAPKLKRRLAFHPEEHPYFVQLFGNSPQHFAEAARALEQEGVDGIDVNMGCPAKKIVASQHGSGLMRDPARAAAIVAALAQAVDLPVSVKTRLGWHDSSQLIPFVQRLVDAGARLITIHGRTYNQHFKGAANWSPIYRLKAALPAVTILGNGDVQHRQDGLVRTRNLDGFMLGRAAIGNPWVFRPPPSQNTEHLSGACPDAAYSLPSLGERARLLQMHYAFLREQHPPRRAILLLRKHLSGYLQRFPFASSLRQRLMQIDEETAFLRCIRGLE